MKKPILFFAVFLFAVGAAIGISNANLELPIGTPESPLEYAAGATPKTMRAFRSEQELKDFFKKLADSRKRDDSTKAKSMSNSAAATPSFSMDGAAAKESDKDEESVTNNQHAGVDEGGIVKVHGDHLVILRRGRLFTVRIGDNSLKPVAAVDAFAPGINPSSDWYDEMLVSEDTVVV